MSNRPARKAMPVFEALFIKQLVLITPEYNINRASCNEQMTINQALIIAHHGARLDEHRCDKPHTVGLGYGGHDDWIIVPNTVGAVAISERGEVMYTQFYANRLDKHFPNDIKRVERLLLKALVCGLSIHRLLTYIACCNGHPHIGLLDIEDSINTAGDLMSNCVMRTEL